MRNIKILFLSMIAISSLAQADYNNTVGSKESAIKGSGAYRQEFERRMSGQTGFENAAKGLQGLSQIINGPPLESSPSYGKSLGEYMADLTIKSLKEGATLKGIGIKDDDIIDAIDKYIKENKKVSDSTVFLKDVIQGYEWKAELQLGIRDPGVVKQDLKAGYKSYKKALEYSQKILRLNIKDGYTKESEAEDGRTLNFKYTLARLQLAGVGVSKDVPAAVQELTEIAEYESRYYDAVAYKSYCVLIPVYAYGSEGFEKNLEKVVELSQKAAAFSLKIKPEYMERINQQDVCVAANPFIMPVIADMKKDSGSAKVDAGAKK